MNATGASTGAEDSAGFAEQLHGCKAAASIAVAAKPIASVTASKVAPAGEQPSGATEPADNSAGAAMLAALLFRVPGAAPTALPMELHLTGDSLPSVKTTYGAGTPARQQQRLSGATDAQALAAQAIAAESEVAASQTQQLPAALRDRFQPQAAAASPSTVPLPPGPPEADSEPADLAFAARLKPASAAPANLTASPGSTDAIPHVMAIAELHRAESDNGQNPSAGLPPAQQMANPLAQTFTTSDGTVSLSPAEKPTTQAASETRVVAPEPAPVKSTEPLKELSLQVGDRNQERVEVRMVERGGELLVAVRTGSADLAHGLREGISDLVSRLQETGFRTDTWRPVHAAASVSAPSGTQQSATQFRKQSDSQSNPGWSQQQSRDQRDQQQSNRPSWVEELEGSLTTTGEPSPGDKHGFFR